MWRTLIYCLVFLLSFQFALAAIPDTPGWYAIPSTTLRTLCPPDNFGGTTYEFSYYCQRIAHNAPPWGSWSSAVMDTTRNRLIVWGGGHNDYYGNELYAVNLNNLTIQRLNNPSVPINLGGSCSVTALADGKPNSRHTYDGIAYMANTDRMFVFGGAVACGPGGTTSDTWTLTFANLSWQRMNPSGPTPAPVPGIVTAYDPHTGRVLLHDNYNFYAYTYASDSFQLLSSGSSGVDYHMTATIDPVRKVFVMMGGGQAWIINISAGSNYARQQLVSSGGSAIINSIYPGLAYDPATDRIVAWNGGNTVYSLNLDTNIWTPITHQNGPGVADTETGTLERWSYSPQSGVFLLLNSMNSNAYTLRLSAAPQDTTPPVLTGVMATNILSNAATITWTTDEASDSYIEYGTTTGYGATVLNTSLTTSHMQQLTGLVPDTLYHYRVRSTDASGNPATSADAIFTTLSLVDTSPPLLSNGQPAGTVGAGTTLTTLSLSTNEPATCKYSTTPNIAYNLMSSVFSTTGGTTHTSSVSGLSNGNTYTYYVRCQDVANNPTTSDYIISFSVATAPPTGSQVTSFQLTSPSTGTHPFTIGLGFKKGDITGVPILNIPNAQVIVKSRWNDNSVKHAIASGKATLTANTPTTIGVLAATSAPAGTALTPADIQAANPQATVQLDSIGTVNLQSLLATPFRTWISGPEMVEAHYRSNVGTDPTLQVWFYVRLYRDGKIWIRTNVENGYADVTTSNKNYVPTVTVAGTTVYNNAGASLTHYAYTRWTQEAWIGGDPQVIPKHDTTYLMESKLVPNYWKRNPSTATLNGLYQSYSPMQNGDLTPNMGDGGYQPQIGLLPLWDALYITSGDSRAYRSVLANANAMNSYPLVWKDSRTRLPPKPSDFPSYAINGGTYGFAAGSNVWEMNHAPSEGYVAYLITGDYWYYETMILNTALNYLALNAGRGTGVNRILTAETRGTAWNIRTLSQAVALAPPDDVVAQEYKTLLANNMQHWKSVKDSLNGQGLGYLYEYSFPYGTGILAPWMEHFFIQSVGMSSDLEPLGSMTAHNEVRDWLYRGAVGILGDAAGHCFAKASAYNLKVSDTSNTDPRNWYQDWTTVYQNAYPGAPCTNTLEGTSGGAPTIPNGYWANLLPAIAYAVDDSATGAAASWSRLTSATNWNTFENSGFDNMPMWGIVPRTGSVTPPTGAGDLNNDRVVNIVDLNMVIVDFGKTTGFNPTVDTAAPTGVINLFDVMTVVSNWGKTY